MPSTGARTCGGSSGASSRHPRSASASERTQSPFVVQANEAFGHRTWSVLGHTYTTKVESGQTYAWHSFDPPSTGVPPKLTGAVMKRSIR